MLRHAAFAATLHCRVLTCTITTVLMALAAVPAIATAQLVSSVELANLEFRHIGPVGNRVASVHGVVSDPLVYYAGAAAGGLWKSVDGGLWWEPLFDDQDVHSIGSIGVADSDPNVVWIGTGEPHIRSNVTIGDGVHRSLDAGTTWEHMGLDATGRVSKIRIHPTNPDIVYVAALGHVHGPQAERGIYRTTDGGRTWEHVLFVGEGVGASDLVMDPNNPRILFAGMWTVQFNTWGRRSGGPDSGIYMSRDGGDTWTKLEGNGLPTRPVGKIGLCMTPADSDRIYALIETGDGVPWEGQATDSGELWRSDDGGLNWRLMTHSRDFGGRTGYYNNCRVLPDDPDEAMFLTAAFTRTIDGGRTGTALQGRSRPGGDYHDLWIDPTDPDRWVVGNDQGVSVSHNRGVTWLRTQLPVAQMYHVTVDNAVPYNVLGNRQDGPSFRGPSNSLYGSGARQIPRGDWHSVGGGESGFATPDPTDPNIVWSSASGSGARGGIVVRYDERTRQFRNVEVWPESTGGWPADGLRYRFQWTFPLLISPHDPNTIYVTSQVVHRTTNGGQSWDVLSPDLTTNEPSRTGISGGLTPDNIGVEYCCVIYAFDESPIERGVFMAGSNDGLVHVSRDGGDNWTNVTANMPGLPPDGVVRGVDISRHDRGKAFVAVEHHQVGDFRPYVYRTRDYGRTWTKITTGIEDHPLSFARWIHEDPQRNGLLYLGTENRLYVSFDDGDHWTLFKSNLPPAPIYGIVVQEHFNDLVLGTYGRGFWILDDVTPLQQMTADVAASDVHLFEPRVTYRFQNRTRPQAPDVDMSTGDNPRYGASINYWAGEGVGGPATIRISDPAGRVVRTLEGPSEPGVNRVTWDLENEPSTEVVMRTPPLYADWVDLGPRRQRVRGGGLTTVMPPGTYTVTLELGGRTESHPLEILKDPNSEGSLADIAAQTEMMRALIADYDAAAEAINRIERIRRQLADIRELIENDEGAAAVVEAGRTLEQSLIDVEEELVQLRTTGTGQDGVRYPAKLIGKLGHLANGVRSADFAPTDQQHEVHEVLRAILRDAQGRLGAVISTELAEYNRLLQQRGMGVIIS